MKDTIVSVRMPSTLVKELRGLAEKNHYMDLSEELRSVIRDKVMAHQSRIDSKSTTEAEKILTQQKTLVQGLQSIIKQLERNEK